MKKICMGDIAIDCANPERLRGFYANLTGWTQCIRYSCPALIAENGLVLLFMPCDFDYIPPVWPEKPGKQQKQMHFNFQAEDLTFSVKRAITLGAKKAEHQYDQKNYVTLFDPEGHPFCLCAE